MPSLEGGWMKPCASPIQGRYCTLHCHFSLLNEARGFLLVQRAALAVRCEL